MTWIPPLSPAERRIEIANAIVPQSRGACTLGVVEAPGRSPTSAPGGWPWVLPAAHKPPALSGRPDGGDEPQISASRSDWRASDQYLFKPETMRESFACL